MRGLEVNMETLLICIVGGVLYLALYWIDLDIKKIIELLKK